ncbi:MAG: hypothetical protein JXR76_19865 [Deltaproteobacteria bacterium]|nr:hypothetical protein [Deltaproteobacteria bacterium]
MSYDMNNAIENTEAEKRYAVTYEIHHTTMDLHEALVLYRELVSDYPESKEARDSRQQIHNIEKLLIPTITQFDRQSDLVRFYFNHTTPLNRKPVSN